MMKWRELPSEPRSFRPRVLERAELAFVRKLFNLPPPVQRLLSLRRAVVIDGQTLDPSLQLLLTLTGDAGRVRTFRRGSIAASRRFMRQHALRYAGLAPRVHAVHALELPGPAGSLRARHYLPETTGRPQPLLVYFHGGGFVMGDLDTHDAVCREFCSGARVHVLSVEYRLAPEHPYPAAREDALAAFRFAQAHAQDLAVDPRAIAVGGDSAGGNLAAVIAQQTRGDRPPRLQLLLYPVTDLESQRFSRRMFGKGFYPTAEDIAWFDDCYGTLARDDPGRAPLAAADFSGLCPALLVTCGFDPLRDEGESYARALEAAGTPVQAWREPDLLHGFLHMGLLSAAAQRAFDRLNERLSAALRGSSRF